MAVQKTAEPRGSIAEVRTAFTRVRRAYGLGKKILKACPTEGTYGKKLIEEQAAKYKLNPDLARKARQMADAVNGYTKEELDTLFALCLEHGYVLGVSVVHKFVSVPKAEGQRIEFQEEAIQGHWTRARIAAELRRRFGTRRQGGRKAKIPEDRQGFLLAVEDWAHHAALMAKQLAESVKRSTTVPNAAKQLKPIYSALKRAERAASAVSGLASQARQKMMERSSRSPPRKASAKAKETAIRGKGKRASASRSSSSRALK